MRFSILVVDDDYDDFLVLSAKIDQCQQNIDLIYAANGLAASQLLIEGLRPKLIVADALMPLMNGYELLVWLMSSEAFRHIPLVIWTGALSDQEVTRYYRAGANSVLLKQDVFEDINTFCRHWFKLVQLPFVEND